MSRLERPTTESSNPATKFLEWKSNDKSFAFYNKEKKENINIVLPFKFLFLEHYHTVKGWHDASESGIYSNEVYGIGKETMKVKAFKGGEIAEGLYKDIKGKVNAVGGKYHRSIYVMLETGDIVNLSIKGSAVSKYSEFYKENHHLLDNQWMEVNEAEEAKKGSIKYSMPVFSLGKVIDKKTDALANEAAATLQNHINSYMNKDVEANEPEPVLAGEETDLDDLEF